MLTQWLITHEQAKREYRYDPDTGTVIGPRGKPIGRISFKNGPGTRAKVMVERTNGRAIPIARLIWFLQTGAWPDTIVDHADADPTNNRWANLRLATVKENNFNSAQPLGVSGYRNVVRGRRGHGWRVEFGRKVNGVKKDLFVSRQFDTPEEAAKVADAMRPLLHDEYASTRKL